MLKKRHRIKSKKEIEVIFKEGSLIKGKFVIARFLKKKKPSSSSFCASVFVGKNYSKLAIQRNRARRLVWAVLLEILAERNWSLDNLAAIFIVKNNAPNQLEKPALKKDLSFLLEKIGQNRQEPKMKLPKKFLI